jgi:hypothetical protein
MSHGKPWTKYEDSFLLRSMRFKKSQRWIGEKLGRTEIAVRSRLVEMKSNRGSTWTGGDEEGDYEAYIKGQVEGYTEALELIAPKGTKLYADVVFARVLQAA